MKKLNKIFQSIIYLLLFAAFMLLSSNVFALTAGQTYTIILSKVNSDGTVTDLSGTTATADLDGKIDFSFSNVPTSPDTFFLVLTVKDSSDVVRRAFVPAPPAGGNGQLGVNNLSTTQTNMILQAMSGAGTDDPIVVAYGLILTRSPNLSDDDINNIAILGQRAIMNGFETFLTDNGVTQSQLNTFKQKLIYNQPNKDLTNFTALFKSAVDNPDQAEDDMAKAAGLIADIFIDAGLAAGIDLGLINAAHDAAGYVVESDPEAIAAFIGLSQYKASIEQAMSNFFMRIAAVKVKTRYMNALNALNASGDQVNRFNSAVQTLMSTMEILDKQYAPYFMDPENNPMDEATKNAIDTAYRNAFDSFEQAIRSTNSEITDMRNNISAATGIPVEDLSDVGTYRDFNDQTVNWPIPQVVAVNWVASILQTGGDLVYDRATVASAIPVPANMNWLNNPSFPDGSGSRYDYASEEGMPSSYAALLGMQEDMMIAEFARHSIWDGGEQPTRQQERDAELAYKNNVGLIADSLTGTTDGLTAISDAQKKALLMMTEHPSLF